MSLLKIRAFSIEETDNFTFANVTANGNITSNNANLGNLATANYFSGNGYYLTGISAATANYANFAGNVTVASQPNITSLGTLTSLNVSGTANLGDISNIKIAGGSNKYAISTDGTGNLTWTAYGNATVAGSNTQIQFNNGTNLAGSANLTFNESTKTLTVDNIVANGSGLTSITGANVTGQVGNALLAGTVYTNAQPNITSIGTLTALNVSGTANLGSASNVKISGGTNGYVLKTDGTGNLTWTAYSNATVAGSNTQIQFNNGTNLAGSANLTFNESTKTLTVDNIVANGSGLTSITGANVTGQVGNALLAGTVYTNAQPNITSIGTLTSLSVTGNTSTGNLTGANLVSANYITGTLTTSAQPNITSVGTLADLTVTNVANANISGYASTVSTAAQPNITSVGTLTSLSVTGNITGTLSTAAQPNITSVGTLTSLSVTGNISSGNANLGNAVTANYFVGNGSLLTGVVAATATKTANGTSNVDIATSNGNVTVGVAGTANVGIFTSTGVNVTGYLTASGTITGGNISTTGSLAAGDTTITGNLTVTGTTTTVNSTVTRIVDPLYEIGGGANGATLSTNDGKERGTILHYYDTGAKDAFMGWMSANAEFAFASNVAVSNNNVTITQLGKIKAGDANLGNAVTSNYFIGNGSLLTGVTATSANYANFAGNVVNASQPNITSVGTLLSLTVSGNTSTGNLTGANLVSANYFSGDGSGLTSITGANVTGQVGNALLAGTVYTNAQPNITSVGTLTSLSVTGNISSGNANLGNLATANYFTGNGSLLTGVTADIAKKIANGTSNVDISSANANVTVSVAGNANVAIFTGTGVNVAGYLNVTGNVALSGANVDLGAVGNLRITGGSADTYLKTNGSGSLSWSTVPSTTLTVDTFTGDGSWTMKNLSVTPLSIAYTIVAVGGVFQPRSSYSISTNVITFSSAPPNTSTVEITTINGGTAGSTGAVYQSVSANTTMAAWNNYIVDTSSTAITLTLPSSPNFGDEIGVIDGTGNAGINNITVNRNGGKIEGSSSNLTVSTARGAFKLVYYNSTQGWIKTVK